MNDLEALKSELAKAHEACARWRQAAELARYRRHADAVAEKAGL